MKCYQCDRPAMYLVTEEKIPLCLHCYSKFSQIEQAEIEQLEREMNYLHDQIYFISGLPSIGPRFPPKPQPIQITGAKLNNINISNSVVGTINTGYLNSVDQTITALNGLGESSIAEAIKELTEATIKSNDLGTNQKNELIEILGVLASEAATPSEERKRVITKNLLERGIQLTKLANDITEITQKWWPVLLVAFQSIQG